VKRYPYECHHERNTNKKALEKSRAYLILAERRAYNMLSIEFHASKNTHIFQLLTSTHIP
jgi:hypothetical protein